MKHALARLFLFLSLSLHSLVAQTDPDLEIIGLEDSRILKWHGAHDHTYFMQVSVEEAPLREWNWVNLIEQGTGNDISYEVGSSAERVFFRLCTTNATRPSGITLEDWDIDNDGLTNQQEITLHQTNPLEEDTDDDHLPDGWEIRHGLSPLDDGSLNPVNGEDGDADGDGIRRRHRSKPF